VVEITVVASVVIDVRSGHDMLRVESSLTKAFNSLS